MKRILIIEDNIEIAELERDFLDASAIENVIETDGTKGLARALQEDFNLILLDIMLPETDGFHICRRIRKEKEAPILMVSAKREDMDKIRGLGLGADDYIIKPFSPTELVARVKAHITRYEQLMGKAQQKAADGEVLRSGDLEIYVDKHRVYVKGKGISLTNREFELLVFLAKHPGLVFSRDRLFERVWGLDAEGDTATVMVQSHPRKNRTGPGQAHLHRDGLGCRIPFQRITYLLVFPPQDFLTDCHAGCRSLYQAAGNAGAIADGKEIGNLRFQDMAQFQPVRVKLGFDAVQ